MSLTSWPRSIKNEMELLSAYMRMIKCTSIAKLQINVSCRETIIKSGRLWI